MLPFVPAQPGPLISEFVTTSGGWLIDWVCGAIGVPDGQ